MLEGKDSSDDEDEDSASEENETNDGKKEELRDQEDGTVSETSENQNIESLKRSIDEPVHAEPTKKSKIEIECE